MPVALIITLMLTTEGETVSYRFDKAFCMSARPAGMFCASGAAGWVVVAPDWLVS